MTQLAPSRAIVVAGMHRSGTSLTASLLRALGVDMGSRLMAADAHNRKGYFEDWDFVDLQRAMFHAAYPPGAAGWIEAGWAQDAALDPARLERFRGEAERLVASRSASPLWGFKDPRTTLLLPFWRTLLPDARYVLVYRQPWDVADSLYRAQHAVFAAHPEFAPRIWLHYNRQILAFHRAHPGACLLVSAHALHGRLDDFRRLLIGKIGVPERSDAAALGPIVEAGLMTTRPADDPLTMLYAAHFPETLSLLGELEQAADLPSGLSVPAIGGASALAALHVAETQRATAAQAALAASRLEAAHAQARAEQAIAMAAAREAELEAFRRSTSWRLTAPMRALVTRCRRGGT